MSESEAVRRGVQAEQELEIAGEAFAALKSEFIDLIILSPWEAQAERERLCIALKSLNAVEEVLRKVVAGGDAAKVIQSHTEDLAGLGIVAQPAD